MRIDRGLIVLMLCCTVNGLAYAQSRHGYGTIDIDPWITAAYVDENGGRAAMLVGSLRQSPQVGAFLTGARVRAVGDHESFTGCYVLAIGAWSHPIGDERGYYTPPDTIRLHDDGTATPTLRYPTPTRRARAWWSARDTDSVTIRWSNGFATAVLTLGRAAADLRGTLEAVSDTQPLPPPPRRIAPVAAQRVECPAQR
jgi:hypothetical protein